MCAQVSEEDPCIKIEKIKISGETGEVNAYLAKPVDADKVPGVLVIHEIWGLVSHIKDITRRFAIEGFISLSPDALSPLGGTPDDVDKARKLMRQLDTQKTVGNYLAAVKYLKTHPQSTGKVGVTGFCWGGGLTNQVAVNSPDVQAAVPFYGRQPESKDVSKIKASLLIHYAGDDERINAGISGYEKALEVASVEYVQYIYEGARHAFLNDTGERYDMEASRLAWKRTVDFFNEKLKT